MIRSMRTELSVVSQTQLYENADMIQKSFRMLVRISIFFCLLLLFYLASFLGVDLDLDFVLQKLNSMLLAKGIRFLFSRLGWFGLLVEGLLVLGDNSGGWCNMMAPSGGSGATWKEDTREIDILLESSWETEDTGSSVNQPVAPPANQVASPGEEAGPSNPVRPFPYHDDDLIGGDSVRDIRSGSPGIWFPSADPEIPPEPGMPQGAPGHEIQHPIPRLDQPLISDRERFIELQGRFHLYYLGRNRITDLAEFAGRLERAVPIERHIEAALVFDGYDPDRIRGRINEIRGILFTHPTRVLLLSEQTLDRYLNEIETNGTRQSAPYMRLVSAIRN